MNPAIDSKFYASLIEPDAYECLEPGQLKTQNSGSFEQVLRQHQSMVFSIALRLLRDRTLAEEIAQDVFLQLYEKLAGLETEDHVKFWLRRTTYHRAIDEVRRRKLRPRVSLDEIREPSIKAVESDPFLSEMLRKLVAALPDRARAIVVMRYQEGLEPTEIAQVLEMPASSVKSLLHRSLKLLRGKVERAGTAPKLEIRV